MSAGNFAETSPPSLVVGKAYGVRLPTSNGERGGTVAFTAPTAGQYLLYLGTPNVPLRTDGEAPTCSRYLSSGSCAKFRGVYLLPHVAAGATVRIRLGQIAPQSWVRLLVLPR